MIKSHIFGFEGSIFSKKANNVQFKGPLPSLSDKIHFLIHYITHKIQPTVIVSLPNLLLRKQMRQKQILFHHIQKKKKKMRMKLRQKQ